MLALFFALITGQTAHADYNWVIHCDYFFYQAPTSSVDLALESDGRFSGAARITMQGSTHLESYTEEQPAENELAHGWISKESEQNKIELVIYKQATSQGQSKLVNHQMPFGQEMWGNCKLPSL